MTTGSPPTISQSDDGQIIIVGAGLSGTLAATLLGRAGYAVTLVDRHAEFPAEFRVEKIAGGQVAALQRLGLLQPLERSAIVFDEIVNARRGRLLDRTRSRHYGIFYRDLVQAMRAELPANVRFVVGRVNALKASAERQTVSVLGQGDLGGRLIVLATGMSDVLRRDLSIERAFIRQRQSLSFGFNVRPAGAKRFRHTALTYYGEQVSDGVDYLSLFPAGDVTRANLFVFRDHRDPWIKALRDRPKETLIETLPGLPKVLGDFEVVDRVQSWLTDITIAENCRQPGVVLIGDAFQTSCPAAGTGVSRLLSDVERLCTVHVPVWMETPGMSATKIAAFYDDPEKQAMDTHCLERADFRRNLTIETGLRWQTRRRIHFARRQVLKHIFDLTPGLAGTLKRLSGKTA
jgi:2-polyprenyl-6-methoxyphenol hydroxylase-like FAD-dependent oxidoreductase